MGRDLGGGGPSPPGPSGLGVWAAPAGRDVTARGGGRGAARAAGGGGPARVARAVRCVRAPRALARRRLRHLESPPPGAGPPAARGGAGLDPAGAAAPRGPGPVLPLEAGPGEARVTRSAQDSAPRRPSRRSPG